MASISGYPHVEMHVRDDSIYIPSAEEILPLNKPLYMMKAARGPVGVPVWCPTYTDAVRVFGADTFNKRSRHFSESAYFLTKTFPSNGAFIMRVASEDAKDAHVSIEIGLSKDRDPSDATKLAKIVPQYKRDVNGNFELELTGAKIPIDENGKGLDEYSEEEKASFVQAMLPGYKVAWRATVRPNDNDTREIGTKATASSKNFVWYPLLDIVAANPGAWGSAYGIKLYFDPTINTLAGQITNGSVTMSLAPIEFLQDATVPTSVVDAYGQSTVTGVIKPDVVDADTEIDLTLNKRVKRAYSGKQALPLNFTYISENWNTVGKELMLAEIAVREQAYKLYPQLEAVQLDGTVDTFVETTDTVRDMSKTYYCYVKSTDTYIEAKDAAFNSDGSFTTVRKYYEKVEVPAYGCKTFVDDLFSKVVTPTEIGADESDKGYMANIASCCNYDGIPYFATCIIDSTDELITSDDGALNPNDIIIPTSDQGIFLGGGWGGGVDDIPYDWEVEEYIRAQIHAAIAGTQDYLNDYWHCPFNAIYDTGVSVKTKKVLMDFMSVRDNIVVNVSSQVTWKKNKADINDPVANSRMDDEAIAANLRAYALLMKEDVENGTGACRCKVFCHAGKTSDHDDKWVPYTLWIAMKNAEYLNKPYIWQEPKELPYSAVECFTETSWTAAQEETKSRVWNSGVNYVQFYNMTGLHFASVRSVYWYETSVLTDAGCVDALCFSKDVIRRSWSTWAGSTRKAAELNQLITDDLNARMSYMLHNKFRFKVKVYQTDEDTKLGYQRHVDVELWAAGQNRVWKATIICKREGYNEEA